jgi:glycosyltransferase involved in cell wall biosynthesis
MHILLIHQSFAALDEPGGTRHHELARYLVEMGHQVTVIASPVSYLTGTAGRRSKVEQSGGVTIRRVFTLPALHKGFARRVLAFITFMVASFIAGLSVNNVDVVWGTSPPIFQGVTAWAVARLKRRPFLFEVRDLWPAFAVQVGVLRNPLLIRASNWLERFLYRHADRVMVNSPGFIQHVTERGARKVELVPNGADPRMFDPDLDGTPFRREHGLEGKFALLYAGAHGLSNDLGVVLEAARLLQTEPGIHFVFLGDGKEKPALQSQSAQMGLQNVTFLPPVAKQDMALAFAGCDASLAILKPIPLYATVYPNKVFDAMAAGKPVILAIEGVIRQVIEAAGAGIAVQPGNPVALAEAVRTLQANPEAARAMGCRGRAYIEQHFDRSVLAGKLSEVFTSLITGKSR